MIQGIIGLMIAALLLPIPSFSPFYANPLPHDSEAEREMLTLVNRDRAEGGLTPLRLDADLSKAAQEHSAEMAAKRQLSHQFSGEPELPQRIAKNSKLQFDTTGENVGYAQGI